VGSAVILYFPCPLVGCRFLSLRHISAHIPSPGRYIRGEWGIVLFTSSLLPPPLPLLQSLRTSDLLSSPRAQIVDAREAFGYKNKMVKGKAANAATSWVPSVFTQKDLDKTKVDGLISDSDSVIFPSTERIPKPKSGFRVMFLAFLLRGLSLPAHEFLRGLLYVYGVQLHQLTPNSLLHIACFITLCELFLGIEPHFIL
jgi:hypothetical protein